MSVLITSITELSQKFFYSDPLEFDEYFAITPDYQKYCLDANLFSRCTVAVAKEAMLIHDIAIHLLAGGCKLAMGGVKGVCGIASGIFGLEPDHQTPSKQAVVHLGFVSLYAIDILASFTNIINRYPQHRVNTIKNIFAKFLETPNKEAVIQYIVDPEIEEALKKKEAEAQAKDLALKEEQEKVKEKEELLRRTQEELEHTRNSEFISEEDLEKIFKEAHEAADEEVNKKSSGIKKQTMGAISSSNKATPNPSAYKLAFDNWSEDEDVVSFSSNQEDDSWFTNEAEILRKAESIEKEGKENLYFNKPFAIPVAVNKSENLETETKIIVHEEESSQVLSEIQVKSKQAGQQNSSKRPTVLVKKTQGKNTRERRANYEEQRKQRKLTAL